MRRFGACELHRISRTNRSKDRTIKDTYIGLNLSIRSEYSIAGTFDRNLFFVQGMTAINYKCGQYGSLPQGHVESSYYPERTLENIPSMIEQKQKDIARLETNSRPYRRLSAVSGTRQLNL